MDQEDAEAYMTLINSLTPEQKETVWRYAEHALHLDRPWIKEEISKMTVRVEEIRRIADAIFKYDSNAAMFRKRSAQAEAAYDAMETPKLLAALQEQTRWRRWPEEKPCINDVVLFKRKGYEAAVVIYWAGQERWAGMELGDTGCPCEEGDPWQPITMPEGL